MSTYRIDTPHTTGNYLSNYLAQFRMQSTEQFKSDLGYCLDATEYIPVGGVEENFHLVTINYLHRETVIAREFR